MTATDENQYLSARELVEALRDQAGAEIEISRNRGESVRGSLIRASVDSVDADGRDLPVVHLLLRRTTRDGATPVMVSLVTGVAPDEDFFWPACRITVGLSSGRQRLHLR
jgi:hypothetical protein